MMLGDAGRCGHFFWPVFDTFSKLAAFGHFWPPYLRCCPPPGYAAEAAAGRAAAPHFIKPVTHSPPPWERSVTLAARAKLAQNQWILPKTPKKLVATSGKSWPRPRILGPGPPRQSHPPWGRTSLKQRFESDPPPTTRMGVRSPPMRFPGFSLWADRRN